MRKKLMGKLKCKKAPGNPRDGIDCSLSNNGGITAEGEKEKEEEDASKFDVKSMPCSSNAIDDGDADSDKNFHIENQTIGGLGEASTSVQQDSFCCGMDNADNAKIRKQRNVQVNPGRPCTCTCSNSEENEIGIQEDKEADFMEFDTTLSRLRGIRFNNGGIEVDFLIV
ncbi:hypothetical protein Dsin_009983 [Dipteronia sinensis]|uniref:Uncharacterized protein n=1 Tax=Dipteronia sinensis TaxID=43782 RepID=A0AAE0ARN3_9ROSI|nr:hypothetical protein Dsin_009983 [Dipteronia sinensis]